VSRSQAADANRQVGRALQAKGHRFEPCCAHQVRGHLVHGGQSAGSQTGSQRATSRRTRTVTSARSRSGSARARPRLRRKVSGKTKQEVREKLKAIHAELNVGLQSSAGYTVRMAMDDWLEHGLSGRSARTVQLYRNGVKPLTDGLGVRPLRKLSAADVRSALGELSDQLSTRSLQIAHNCLVRAVRQAEADDLVGRNVAALVRPPAGH